MGLKRAYIEYIQKSIDSTIGAIQGKKMLELGNQHIARRQGIEEKTGKSYYSKLGAEHISVDLNGKDGAVILDLSTLIDKPEWIGYFDIITNAGTTEHVEPYEAQFECFTNLHNWLKKDGIIIHINPAVEELESNGRWKNHCNNYYSKKFFEVLAESNNYKIISSTVIDNLRSVCLLKKENNMFMTDRQEFLKHITRKNSGRVYFGINDKEISFFSKIILRFRDLTNIVIRKLKKYNQ